MPSSSQDAKQLIAELGQLDRVVVAFSGGVDSSVVAAAAQAAELDVAVAVTAQSPSVPRWQLDLAVAIAAEIGIDHHLLPTHEGDRTDYRSNDGRRCYYCKETLYQTLAEFCQRFEGASIVSGTNADDLGDYRPGIEAGNLAGVATPLARLGIGKTRVRALAKHFGLSNHDLPASPCLASRVAYGTTVTPERLARIERAEDWLRTKGLRELRVRLHEGELARVEVPKDQIGVLLALDAEGEMSREFKRLGFHFVTVDLDGFRSGNMNRVLVSIGQPSSPHEDEAVH